jgi:TPP-dependent 2-oxoacid decarboxylase
MSDGYAVADYLLDRLVEVGAQHVFGVPGDFTLGLLDHIDAHPDLEWVGTANELGAGYAADGYARIRGIGVVCTTFGVGELSAINAVAGSYAEHVPVLHLVGSPTTAVQHAGRPTHHTLGDGDFGRTLRMSAEVTVAQAALRAEDAIGEIDRVLTAIVRRERPGYLSLPTDVAELPAPRPSAPLVIDPVVSDADALRAFRAAAAELLDGAARPVVLADIFVHRAHAESALHELLEATGLRYASLLWGRRVVDESGPNHLGTYIGAASAPDVREAIEGAERLITAGVYFTDLISGFFSQHLTDETRINLLPHSAVVAGVVFEHVEMRDALDALRDVIPASDTAAGATAPVAAHPEPELADTPLTQEEQWRTVAAALRLSDLVIADQGTSYYGMGTHRLPHDAVFIGQPLWASIGYTLPALLGAALADPARRPVLLIGDGAAQLTIAELGTLLRERIPALVVVSNNNGYTVERAIHGPTKAYNAIAPWRWAQLPEALGAGPDAAHAFRVTTSRELAAALAAAAAHPDRLTFVEAVTHELDVPTLLDAVARAAAQANAHTAT